MILCLSLYPWASFAAPKDGIKLHTLLDHDGYLPAFVAGSPAREPEIKEARSLSLAKGSIVVEDLGYTNYVEMRYRISLHRLGEIQEFMASYGAEETKGDCGSIPWKEIFPDFNPSLAPCGARKRENRTQQALAKLVGINQTHISKMENLSPFLFSLLMIFSCPAASTD